MENIPASNPGEILVPVISMEDLINLSDSLFKPVIHIHPSVPGDPHEYYVSDGTTRYRYVLGDDVALEQRWP